MKWLIRLILAAYLDPQRSFSRAVTIIQDSDGYAVAILNLLLMQPSGLDDGRLHAFLGASGFQTQCHKRPGLGLVPEQDMFGLLSCVSLCSGNNIEDYICWC